MADQDPVKASESQDEPLPSLYSLGRPGYVWTVRIFAAIAAPLFLAAIVLLVLAVLGVVPWRVPGGMAALGCIASGVAYAFYTADGTTSGDYSVGDFSGGGGDCS